MAVGSRKAEIELTANPSGIGRGLAAARGALGAFGRSAKSILGGAAGAVGNFLKSAFNPLGRGISLLEDAGREVFDFEKGIARMAIAQGKTNEQMSGFRDEITKVSDETGIARNDILRGASAYQALTGDTKGAAAAMRTFARVAQATGSNVDDIAATSAALGQNLKIDPKDLEAAFSILNTQGKAGAIELKDMAAYSASLAAGFQRFKGGKGISGLQEMGGALQIIRRNFGTAGEAATGFSSLMTAIIKNAKKLEAAGVKVFDKNPKTGKKTLREFSSIVRSIGDSSLMKDPTKLAKALGRGEAAAALQAITSNWADFKGLVDTTDVKSIGRDMQQYLESPAGRLEKTWNGMKLAIAEAFTPDRINKFASALDKVAKAAGPIADFLGKAYDTFAKAEDLAAGAGKEAGRFFYGSTDQSQADADAEAIKTYKAQDAQVKAVEDAARGGRGGFTAVGAGPAGPSSSTVGSVFDKPQITPAMIAALLAAQKKQKVEVKVKVDAGDGIAAKADNDRGHRNHPK